MKYMEIEDHYRRALNAEQDLLAVEAMVCALAQATRPRPPLTSWSTWPGE